MTPSSSILLVAPPAQYGIDSSAADGEFAWWRLRTSRPASAVARSLPAPGDIISRSRPASAAGCGVERRVRVLVPPTPTRPVTSAQHKNANGSCPPPATVSKGRLTRPTTSRTSSRSFSRRGSRARRAAGSGDARLLRTSVREAVVTLAAVAYDVAGRAIDAGREVFRADRYSFDSRHVNP